MSASPPATPPPSRPARPRLSRRAVLLVALAFAAGLALFLLLWLDQRNDNRFFRAGGTPAPGAQDAGEGVFEPLPAPGASADGGEVMPAPTEEPARGTTPPDRGRDTAGQPLPPAGPLPPPAAPEDTASSSAPDRSATPLRSPQPRYPARAMRRGEAGTVLLQVHVDASGRPERVDVVQSSRSRELDREAQRTVERWLFSPALRGGRAVPSTVLVPIEFRP